MPQPKRCRTSVESDPDSPEHNNTMSPRSHSTITQLTGNFCMAMDLWTDCPNLGGESIKNSPLGDVILVEVTDEEMNKFWDTLPKKYGGLM